MIQRGNIFTLRDNDNVVMVGGLTEVETYLESRYVAGTPGPRKARIPTTWAPMITAYCTFLAAAGQSPNTIRLRRLELAHIARGVAEPPKTLTAEQLVNWFR